MDKERLPFVLRSELKTIYFNLEDTIFQINGKDIGYLTDIDISFHNNQWNVTLTQKESFTQTGKRKKTSLLSESKQ